MCLTEFDEEEAKRIWHEDGYAEGLSEGLSKGLAEGESKKSIDDARSFYNNGVSIAIIAKSLNMTEEQVRKIIAAVPVPENI